MKRKLVAMLLLSSMLLTTVGCAKKGESVNADKGKGAAVFDGKIEKNVTIHVLENDTAIEKGYFKELIEAFNEKYKSKGIKAVDANMDQHSDLAKDGPYGYGPGPGPWGPHHPHFHPHGFGPHFFGPPPPHFGYGPHYW